MALEKVTSHKRLVPEGTAVGAGMKALKAAADKALAKTKDAAAKNTGRRIEGTEKGTDRYARKGAAGTGLKEAKGVKASTGPCPFYDRGSANTQENVVYCARATARILSPRLCQWGKWLQQLLHACRQQGSHC